MSLDESLEAAAQAYALSDHRVTYLNLALEMRIVKLTKWLKERYDTYRDVVQLTAYNILLRSDDIARSSPAPVKRHEGAHHIRNVRISF